MNDLFVLNEPYFCHLPHIHKHALSLSLSHQQTLHTHTHTHTQAGDLSQIYLHCSGSPAQTATPKVLLVLLPLSASGGADATTCCAWETKDGALMAHTHTHTHTHTSNLR